MIGVPRRRAWLVVLLATAVGGCASADPRSGVEPLPEGLVSAAEHDVPGPRIEGKGLCMLVVAQDGGDAEDTLERLETHLLEEKAWDRNPLGESIRWAPVSLMQQGPRALVAGPASEYLEFATSADDCRPLEGAIGRHPEAVLLDIYIWER